PFNLIINHTTIMSAINQEIEQQIQLAMEHLSEQSKPNISKTAREFAVPMHRLRRRWQGGKSLFQRPCNGRKLSPAQEKALCEYIDYFDAVGASINRRQIAITANSILQYDHTDPDTDPPQIGAHWLPRFLKRNPKYHIRRRRALDVERAKALDKTVVERWFKDYQRVIHEHGICQQDIYNFDETGFQIGVGRDQFIITRHPKKKLFNGSVTNRESITVLEAVSADGFTCPLLIILSTKQALLRWFDNISSDEHIATTDTGYINDTLAFQWIQLFHKWTIGRTLSAKRLVLCDRFGSYLTSQFIQFYSYDPYHDHNHDRPETPSTCSQNTEFSTPKTAEKFRTISHRLNRYNASTQRFKDGLAKLTKGAEAQATLAYQLQREFDNTKAIMGARHARYDNSRHYTHITGIINSAQVKNMKYKEYKLTEKIDQEKTKRKWKKVLIEIRKHGRAKKRGVK
ncbi:hypothetical protein VN97_g13176, partial [Penicillium thymicola]